MTLPIASSAITRAASCNVLDRLTVRGCSVMTSRIERTSTVTSPMAFVRRSGNRSLVASGNCSTVAESRCFARGPVMAPAT